MCSFDWFSLFSPFTTDTVETSRCRALLAMRCAPRQFWVSCAIFGSLEHVCFLLFHWVQWPVQARMEVVFYCVILVASEKFFIF
jgi:hypothetical protein